MLNDLIKIADRLDALGLIQEANTIDKLIKSAIKSSSKKRKTKFLKQLAKETLTSGEAFMHISGPPASGKTTLMEEVQALHPDVVTKDLDEFDEIATEKLGLDPLWKINSWTEETEKNQFDLRQNLLNQFLQENLGKRVLLVGIHTEWGRSLQFKVKYRILLNTDPKEAFKRRKKRDMKFEGAWKFWEDEKTYASELKESIAIFEDLKNKGYTIMSREEILSLFSK